ncbi:MAG TPA: DUF998 domain-containing protein [Gemmatimonadaceae bacterium]|nr:DUF998 domain-containing protein [Gemmatimonadaceae bacterium]
MPQHSLTEKTMSARSAKSLGRTSAAPFTRDGESVAQQILPLGGVLGPAVFTTLVIVCAALRPEYSHLNQFISELGATGTTDASLMNRAGFIPAGALIAGFGIALIRQLSLGVRSILAGSLIAFFGVGMSLAGFFPCDPGCPQPPTSLAGTIHDRVSVAAFVAAIAGIGLWAMEFRTRSVWRGIWLYSALASAASLLFLIALATSIDSRSLTGLWQRLLIATVFGWYAVVALRLVRLRAPASNAGTP